MSYMLSLKCQKQCSDHLPSFQTGYYDHIQFSVSRIRLRTEFESTAFIRLILDCRKIGVSKYLHLSFVQLDLRPHGIIFDQSVDCDSCISQLSKSDLIQRRLQLRNTCLMTNDRIKSDSRTDCKPSAFLSIIYDTDIHLLYCLRMQNKMKCFDGIFWNLHSSCKIITGSSRNISQDHIFKILYSV